MGITTPTAVQVAVIPDGLAGRDIIARAPTGTGKTLAFAVPLVAALADGHSVPGHPRAVVITPTRELANQIAQVLSELGRAYGLRTLSLIGGEKLAPQQRRLAAPADIVVVTPGRAGELIRTGLLRFDKTVVAVVDEADELADMGFLPEVNRILNKVPNTAQLMLCSATLGAAVEPLYQRLQNPVRHEVGAEGAVVSPAAGAQQLDRVQHFLLIAKDEAARDELATWLAARPGRTILFVGERFRVGKVHQVLADAGIDAGFIHGRRGHTARAEAVRGFAASSPPVLVATDVAARGLDIDDVELVVHVDPAADAESYVHRSGRTARAGRRGIVATLITRDGLSAARAVLAEAGVSAQELDADLRSGQVQAATGARRPPGRPRRSSSTDTGAPERRRKAKKTPPKSRRGIPVDLQVGLDGNEIRPRTKTRRDGASRRGRSGGTRRR
nr:DEAD/DEAH box helicase [Corynebacterium sp. TAE3-ERU12]